ncbi:response regulator [Fulvivirga sp. RKSG066]|uniref:ATP-binding protein n=1 Tax=Fulvivirga aurantia TaxID=2529383 RepID=UPI0012BBC55F|nr:ATP-binding protein [Fulvivirga aurantia]MTI21637.1 response regulator [Fulvivirga aurantia]
MIEDLKDIIEKTNIATVIVDGSQKLKHSSPSAKILFNISERHYGQSIFDLKDTLLEHNLEAEVQRVVKTFESTQTLIKTKDGKIYSRRISPYKSENKELNDVVLTFQDITNLQQLSRAANRRIRQQATIAQLGMLALSGIHLKDLMDQLVKQVADTLQVEFCKVLQYRPEKNDLLLLSGVGWGDGIVGKASVPDKEDSQAGFTLIQNDPVIVRRMSTEKRFTGPDLLLNHGVVSGMSVVINHSTPPFGVLGVHTSSYYEFDQDDSNFIQSIANLLSVAIKEKQITTALTISDEKLRIAKDSAKIGAFEFFINSEQTHWDHMLKEIWGLDEDESPTQEHFWQGIHPDDLLLVKKALKIATNVENGHFEAIYRVVNKQTKDISWVQANATMMFNQGTPFKMIGMAQDITKLKNSEETLKTAVEELQKINVRTNQFLATLGHELRNPLAALRGGVDLLKYYPEEAEKAVDMMDRNVDKMASMLDDLLDLARIIRGNVPLAKEYVNVKELIERAVYEAKHMFSLKDQQIEISLSNEPMIIKGDPTRLNQVLSNLLTNSNKFTDIGGKVSISAYTDQQTVKICIEDNGIGIDGNIESIFEPFSQIRPSKGNKGLGIGLSLVKSFMEMHEGTIMAESMGAGQGSKFTLTFPLAEKQKPNADDKQSSNRIPKIKKNLQVLIVDDNEDALDLLKIRLTKLGCQVSAAYNAKQGLHLLDTIEPEVFILDIGLPDMEGNILLQKIKEIYKKDAIYIAHTGFGHQNARENSLNSGFDYHLTKPLNMENLVHILQQVH